MKAPGSGFVGDMIAGVLAAHPADLRPVTDQALVRADAPVPGKVGIATGGGAGLLPACLGYLGPGLADGAAVGEACGPPSALQMLAVTEAVNSGMGVLYLYAGDGGDCLSFELAAELAGERGIEVTSVALAGDIAPARAGPDSAHRGSTGIAFLYKVAGAAAAEGAALSDVKRVTGHAAANLRSAGAPVLPGGAPETASQIAAGLVEALLADLPFGARDEVAVIVNGQGGTSREQLHVLCRTAIDLIGQRQIRTRSAWVGEYATRLGPAAASISLLRLDDELARLLAAPARSPLVAFP